MTYLTDCPYVAEKITLVDGYGVIWNDRLHVSLSYERLYVHGDFDRNGLRDAAVIISGGEGNSNGVSLAFLINDGKRLIHRVSHDLGDSVVINSLKERNGKVIIDMFVHQEGDCRAGPTKHIKQVYDYLNPNPACVSNIWMRPQVLAHGLRGLQEIYNTPIPAQIRKEFDRMVQIRDTYSQCPLRVINGELFMDFYSKKILVMRVSPDGSGVWAAIAVDSDPRKALRLWLYDVDGDHGYDLCSIVEIPESVEEGLIRQLCNPDYCDYWL